MTTFITNGASSTGTALAHLLNASGRHALFGSRSGNGIPDGFDFVKFDWYDPSTFTNPFQATAATGSARIIDSVYLLTSSPDMDPLKFMGPFIDLAIENGVKRFVLMTGTRSDITKTVLTPHGKVHKYLQDKGVDYFVVRPSFFMENFIRVHGFEITAKSVFQTAAPTAKSPFIAVEDIAQAIFEAIVKEKNDVTEKIIVGPELLTYDEVAVILSEVLGRKITHTGISTAAIIENMKAFGIPHEFSELLGSMYGEVEAGEEEKLVHETPADKKHVGKITIREWAEKNKALLQPKAF